MNDERNSQNACPVVFNAVKAEEGLLYGVSEQGLTPVLYPLFVFGPLAQAYKNEEVVPFAPRWYPFMQPLLLGYVPVQFIEGQGSEYSENERTGDEVRPWTQLTYRGWPLYFLLDHTTLGPVSGSPTMFMPAEANLLPPTTAPAHDGRVGGPPGPYLGP